MIMWRIVNVALGVVLFLLTRSDGQTCPSFTYDAVYDLQNNNVNPGHPRITTVKSFAGQCCGQTGVLKLNFASAQQGPNERRALIDFFFTNPTGWSFHLGDSSTNNGYGGDSSTQSWDAEVQGLNKYFTGYLSDNGGSIQVFNIPNAYNTRLTLLVGDGHVVWLPDNHDSFNYFYNSTFFALNGQYDTTGSSNYDLYLGINRVVNPVSNRVGTGLCRVGIKFLPEYV